MSELEGRLNFVDRSGRFSAVEMDRFDVIVIGAGITGCGVARDAAMRGLKVLLVDAGDIASGTSSRSSKMIHGGLRYLAQGDVNLVREAASERQTLRSIAPHLSKLCPFVLPGSWGYTTKLRAGLTAFENLGKVPDVERHEVWNSKELEGHEPTIGRDRFGSAVVYPEFLTNDARLTLANARSAAAAGATVLTYAPVTRIIVDGGQAVGVEMASALPGESFGCRATGSVIVNAAGPWVDAIRQLESDAAPPRLTMTKGIHVVIPHDRLPVTRTIAARGPDKRPVFAVPVRDVTYIGTTDTFYPSADSWPGVEMSDVDYLFEFVRMTFEDVGLEADDVVSMWAGVRPLISQRGKSPSEISRKDETWVGPAGVLSIAGGKLTAYRTMAERVTDMVVEQLGLTARPCTTGAQPVIGGDVDVVAIGRQLAASIGAPSAERLTDLYGSEAPSVAARGGDMAAEVAHAIEAEGALTLTDFWVRRSANAWFTLDPVGSGLADAAIEMGSRLGWADERRVAELAECTRRHTDTMSCLAPSEPAR